MKSRKKWKTRSIRLVAPLVGAWIEIRLSSTTLIKERVAPLVGAWIEIDCDCPVRTDHKVAPLVGAWIEIPVKASTLERIRSLLL